MANLKQYQLSFVLMFLYFTHIHCEDTGLSDLAKKVKTMLPPEAMKKIFSVQRDDPDQFVQAVRNGVKVINELFNATLPDKIAKKLIKNGEDYKNKVVSHIYFRVMVNSEADTLKDGGVLKSDNVEQLAKALTKNLQDAAMSLKTINVQETYPAIITANIKLLKSSGLTSPKVQRNFVNNINLEIKKLKS